MSGRSPETDLALADSRLAEAPTGMTHTVCRDRAAVAAVAPEWDDLLARSICNRAFGSSRWFLSCCAVEPGLHPRVVIVRRGEALAGVLPLVESAEGALRFPGELADYNDAIVERGDLEPAAALLAGAQASASRLELSCVRPDANLVGALARLEPWRDPSAPWSGPGSLVCPHLALGDGYEAYLATRGSAFRNRLRRAWRRAGEHGIEVRELDPEGFPPAELPALFLALHTERIPRTCFARPLERAFAEAALPALFAERRLRAFAVFDGSGVVGVSLYMVGDDSLGHWNGGFRAAVARFAPGKLLLDLAIRSACREGLGEIDLMRGDETYKAEWATGTRTIGRLELGPQAAAGRDDGAAP